MEQKEVQTQQKKQQFLDLYAQNKFKVVGAVAVAAAAVAVAVAVGRAVGVKNQ
jgi:predicted GTPase